MSVYAENVRDTGHGGGRDPTQSVRGSPNLDSPEADQRSTLQDARFHPAYGDLRKYLRRVAEDFGASSEVRGAIWGTQGKGQIR